jgi:nitric oxide dioxygenase
VPALEAHGRAITSRFYQLLFESHPELLNIFNHVNQKQGRQQAALANAVYAAARYIDQLETILPVVQQIAHKHRSLGVKPEHYPVVGKHLLLAIKEVLGDAATDEILGAWAEAYGVIADVFISVERQMYERAASQPGGWEGFRAFVIARKVAESEVITSFYLRPADGGAIAAFEPGQYISVKLDIPGEQYTHIRQYSLSDAPGKGYYRISVKREDAAGKPEGRISTHLHRDLKEGDTVLVSAPAGDFTLRRGAERPVVLISGGVGLTPMVSMLNTLVSEEPARPVTFIHAAAHGRVHAMGQHVAEIAAAHPQVRAHLIYSEPTEEDRARGGFKEGRIDLAWLQSVVPSKDADFYFCGPIPFMSCIRDSLRTWGVPEERIHFEFFGPAADLSAARDVGAAPRA